jgi:PAS domain S-box-containing protein
MSQLMQQFLSPPAFTDEEQTRLASLMRRILLVYTATAVVTNLAFIPLNYQSIERLLANVLFALAVCGGLWLLVKRGQVRLAAGLLIAATGLFFIGVSIIEGGVRAPASYYYIVPILLSWLLLGWRAGVVVTIIMIVLLLLVAAADETFNLLPPLFIPSSYQMWSVQAISFAVIAWSFYLATSSLQQALDRARRSETELACRNTDLTEQIARRQQVEEAYRLLVEQSLQGMYISQDTRIAFANRALGEMLGYSTDELYALEDPVMLLHPDDRDWIMQRMRNRAAGLPEPSVYEIRAVHRDGRTIHLELSVVQFTYRERPAVQVTVNDITERKRAEEALRISEERYRTLVESLPGAAVILYDRDLRYVLVDGSEIEQTGFSQAGMIGRTVPEVLPPDFYAYIEPHLHAALAGESHTIEAPFEDLVYTLSYLPVRGDSGEIIYGMMLALNITEQVRSRSSLVESEEKFAKAFHNSPTPMAINRLSDVRYIDVNESYLQLIGATREQVIGAVPYDIGVRVMHGDRDERFDFIRQGGRGYREENQLRICSGEVRDVSLSIEGITLGGELCLLAVLEDITERNLAEEALRRSEERFRSVVENALLGVYILNDQYQYEYANEELARMLGYRQAAMIGMDIRPTLPPETRDFMIERYEARLRGDTLPARYETVLLRSDGEPRNIEITAALVNDYEGRPVIMGQMLDITERKQAERDRLELAVAQEKVDLMRVFISNITHDVKTPLASILMSLHLLERYTDPLKRQEKIDSIREQIELLQRLILNMLTISRLEYIPDLNREPTDLNALLVEIERQFGSIIEQKQLVTTLDLDPALPLLPADIGELQRALANLVENSVNYTPDGRSVTLRTRRDTDTALVEITDTGIGISADDLPHIFERFYRSSEARSKIRTGSGLGLAIVKRVIEMHGGAVTVESVVGSGTTFRVRLPLANEAVL